MSTKPLSDASVLHQFLAERGAGFVFLPSEIPADGLGISRQNVPPKLFTMTKTGLLTREAVRVAGRTTFRYTTTARVADRSQFRHKAAKKTCPRASGYTRRLEACAEASSVDELVDAVLVAVGHLQALAAKPLSTYTNAQLTDELYRREHNQAPKPPRAVARRCVGCSTYPNCDCGLHDAGS